MATNATVNPSHAKPGAKITLTGEDINTIREIDFRLSNSNYHQTTMVQAVSNNKLEATIPNDCPTGGQVDLVGLDKKGHELGKLGRIMVDPAR